MASVVTVVAAMAALGLPNWVSEGHVYVACERCGCRMITKANHAKSLLICADCGHRVAQVQQRQTLGSLFAASFLLLFLIVLVVITARLEPSVSSDLELEPVKERSRGE